LERLATPSSSATIVTGSLGSWCGDNQALIVLGGQASPALHDLGCDKTTPLEANSSFYLWAQ